MSQAGQISVASEPSVPIEFVTNSGVAVPLGNTLNIFGSSGITTSGAGDTVTISLVNEPFTTGSVIFAGSGGNLSQDNANFFYNSSTHKLQLTALELTTGAASGYVLTSDASGNASWTAVASVGVTSITGTANQVLVNATTGAPQMGAITLTLPQSIATSSNVTFNGLNLGGLTASQAVVTDGSKNLASMAYVSTGGSSPIGGTSNIAARDSNGNSAFNNVFADVTGNAAAGTITLTAASSGIQTFSSGSGSATVVLPVASTLVVGWRYQFNNNASGNITIQTADTSNLVTMSPGSYIQLICTSNSGTAGQWDYHWLMPANAKYGTAGLTVTGTITGTTSVSSPELLVTGGSSGTISILPQAAAGTYNFNLPTTAGTSGYLLTSDGGGSGGGMTWSNPASISVTSISGTANQIAASASTGAVTLSLTNGVSIGSYQSTSPPSGGLIVPGQTGIGSSSPNTYCQLEVDATSAYNINISGTQTAVDSGNNQVCMRIIPTLQPTNGSTVCYSIGNTPNFIAPSGKTIASAYGIYNRTSVSSNVGTITNLYGLYGSTSSGAGTVTNVYSGYFLTPSAGTVSVALYADNMAIGTSGTNPPTNGLLVNGNIQNTALSASLPVFTDSSKNLTSTGIVDLSHGGTNANLTASNGGIFYSTASAGAILAGTSTAGQLLTSGASTTPAWTTSTYPATNAINTLLYASSANTMAALATGNNGVLITSSSGVPSWLSAGTTGQVLIATTGSPASWGTIGSITVTSIAGTANQIAASASTGAVTLSLTNGVSLGSYQSTSPPTGGLIMPGQLSVGTSSPLASCMVEMDSTSAYNLNIAGIQTGVDGGNNQAAIRLVSELNPTNGSNVSYSIDNGPTFVAPSGKTISAAYGFLTNAVLNSNAGIITTYYGIYSSTTGGAGVITTAYSGYFANPTAATTNFALYSDNMSIGYSAVQPPSAGLIVQGQVGIGNSAPSSSCELQVSSTNAYNTFLAGTQTAVNGSSNQFSLLIDGIMQPTNGGANVAALAVVQEFVAPSGKTITNASGIWIHDNFTLNVGTITTAYGIYIDTGSGAGTGTITNAYSAYFTNPNWGATIKCALYSDNASVGYNVSPPSSGSIISGQLGVGTSSPNSSCKVDIQTATAYSLNMGGTQTAVDGGSNQLGIRLNSTYQPTSGATSVFPLGCTPTIIAPSAQTITSAYGVYSNATLSSNVGTITTYYGIYSNTTSGAGTITTTYSGYFNAPSAGTTPVALYSDNLSVGYTATTPPSSGMIVSGKTGLGTTSPSTYAQLSISSTNAYNTYLAGTQTAVDGSSNQSGIYIASTFDPTSGATACYAIGNVATIIAPSAQTITSAYGLYNKPVLSSNVGTITTYYGLYSATSSGAGTITTAYSGYFAAPSAGTTKCALYSDNISIGYTGAAPVTNGMIVSGDILVGSSSNNPSTSSICITAGSTNRTGINSTGTMNPSGGAFSGFYCDNVFAPTSNSTSCASFNCYPDVNPPMSVTITNAYGLWIQSGAQGGAGTVTNGYAGYFTQPGYGTNSCALYTDNLSVGVAASGTPTAGTIRTAPPASHTVTTAFGTSLTQGTSTQNTTGYDIVLNIFCAVASESVNAVIKLGVGSTSTPTTDTVIPSFSNANATSYNFMAYVPSGYYVLVATTGSVTLTITTQAMAV